MALVKLGNEQDFQKAVDKKGPVLVDFYADWCGPCKMIAPVLKEVASEGYEVVKVDTESLRGIAAAFQIQSIPTLIMFVDGKPVEKHMGFLPKQHVLEWFNNHKK